MVSIRTEKDWQIQSDADTLMRAAQITGSRKAAALKELKSRADSIQRACGGKITRRRK